MSRNGVKPYRGCTRIDPSPGILTGVAKPVTPVLLNV